MCSELFRIPYVWGGVPIFGFGVLLVLWAISSALSLAGLVRRHGWSGETWSAVPVMVLAGAAIVFLPRVFPEGMPIRGYGVLMLAGIVTGIGMAMVRAPQLGLDRESVLSLAVWMIICGVVGARAFHVIEYWNERYAGLTPRDTLIEILNVPEGGLVIYGGFFGAAIGFIAFCRKERLPLLAMADLVAPSLAIGMALGRIGCLLNGCCYGGPTDRPWAVTFPKYASSHEATKPLAQQRFSPPYADQAMRGDFLGLRFEAAEDGSPFVGRVEVGSPAADAGLPPGAAIASINNVEVGSLADCRELVFTAFVSRQPLEIKLRTGELVRIVPIPPPERSRPVHPAQLYSAIDAGLLGWLLWSFYPLRTRDGQVLALLLTIHPVTRFLLEVIRTDEPAVFGTGLSISQNISIVLLFSGFVLWWYLSRRPAHATGSASTPDNRSSMVMSNPAPARVGRR